MLARLVPLALIVLAACNGGNAAPMPDGPASLGVIAGNHQVVPAAPSARLPDPVVAQAVRLPNGQVGFRVMDAVDMVLPPKAYAQTTTVNGIPNLVVCVTAPVGGGRAMKAEVPCATTDAAGKATFVFLTDSIAGPIRGRIAAALATGTQVTDSVSATVVPGVVDSNYKAGGFVQQKGDTVMSDAVRDRYGNKLPFRIVSDSFITVADTVAGSLGARRFTFVTPSAPVERTTDVRGASGARIARMRYGLRPDATFFVVVAGLNRTP